ncbi:MAG: hypothetical protein AAGG69_10305 [Pseudomonadota bacterium]
MEPKIRYETVKAVRPFIPDEDKESFLSEVRAINERDARDGTNEMLDASLDDIEPDPDY